MNRMSMWEQKALRLAVSLALATGLTGLGGVSLLAQGAPGASPRAATLPAAQALAQIGQSAGVIVLADSTVQGRVPAPAVAATPETVEQQIAAVVSALPAGTTWAKLYVPAPANGRWNGDAVANYAHALAQMVGTVGRASPAGMVEILGRQVPVEKANEYAAALNLKLVYLVTDPRAQTPVVAGSGAAANWLQMTPAQRELYIQQQAQRVLALDPASRLQTLQELMANQEITPQQALMKAVLSQMTDDERVALKQSFAGSKVGAGGGK